jgi:hypothetical protein
MLGSANFCEHGVEPSGSVDGRNILCGNINKTEMLHNNSRNATLNLNVSRSGSGFPSNATLV